jgi:hypothetical protein
MIFLGDKILVNINFPDGISLYEFGQIFGILIAVLGLFTYSSKKRSTILLVKGTTDVLSTVQQTLIGAYTGASITLIAILRSFVFYNREKKKWASHKFWLWFFVVTIGSTPLFTWAGPESILPMVGSVIMVFGFYNLNPHATRILALFGHGLWLLYGIFHLNFGTVLSNVVYITAAIIGLVNDYKIKKKQTFDGE